MNHQSAGVLRNFFSQVMAGEGRVTRDLIRAIPEERSDFRPQPRLRTALELAWHMALDDVWHVEGVIDGTFREQLPGVPQELQQPDAMADWHERQLASALGRLDGMPPESLIRPLTYVDGNTRPSVMYLGISLHHMLYHRGQLSVYLRLMGSDTPPQYRGHSSLAVAAVSAVQL